MTPVPASQWLTRLVLPHTLLVIVLTSSLWIVIDTFLVLRHTATQLGTEVARFSREQAEALQFSEYSPLTGRLASFAASRDIAYAEIVDADGALASTYVERGASPKLRTILTSESARNRMLINDGLSFYLNVNGSILSWDGHEIGRIRVLTPISRFLAEAGRSAAVLALICALSAAVQVISIRRRLTSAGKVLTEVTGRLRSAGSALDLAQVNAPTDIEELADLATAYNQLVARLQTAEEKVVQGARLAAVARTTQMLAHDVRRPFSLMKMGLDMLIRAESDPSKASAVARRTREVVEESRVKVEGMLADILDASGEVRIHRLPTSLVTVADQALRQVYGYGDHKGHVVDLRLAHIHLHNLDPVRIERALTNLLDNARQAAPTGATITITAAERSAKGHDDCLEITVHNTGSVIAKDDLPQIFESFFTKGKRNGTGLGLAIVKATVTAHGGTVLVESSVADGTRFTMRFPSSPVGIDKQLPVERRRQAADLRGDVSPPPQKPAASLMAASADADRAVIDRLQRHVEVQGHRIRMLVVEDEPSYREGIRVLAEDDPELAHLVQIDEDADGRRALDLDVVQSRYDVVVCDVDLGSEQTNGLNVVRQLRQRAFLGTICVHSNRSLATDLTAAIDAGADAYVPKPMSRSHLLSLLARVPHGRASGSPAP